MPAKYKKHVYCECKFLETCISSIKSWTFNGYNLKELELWLSIKAMIFSKDIALHLDISKELFLEIAKKRTCQSDLERCLQQLYFQQQKGESLLKLTDDFITLDKIDFSNNTQLTSWYLTCCDCELCKTYMNEYGIMIISPERIGEFKCALLDSGLAICKGESYNWKN